MTQPEFSRTVRMDTIGSAPRLLDIQADRAERDAIARRFGLAALDRLDARISLVRIGEEVIATGRIGADVAQSCVVTAQPVPERIDEGFEVRFRAEPPADAEEEIELAEEELEMMFHDGAQIDVGEAVAQTLALNLDPYPRAPGAPEALKEAGVKDEGDRDGGQAGPFGALAALKGKLQK